ILLGKQGSSTVGFSVIDGKSNEILDVSFQESPKARTKLEFIHKNTIYLTSTPFYNIAPKITMAVDLETGESEFVYHSAPLVTGLYMGESGYLAIGNRGMGRERKTIPVPYNGESNKPAVLIIDKELAAQMPPDTSSDSINCEIIYETLGDAVKEGDPDSNPITEVITKLVDIDGDGNEEILSLLVAESAFTRGNIRLELRNSDGELRSSWVGPEEEKGDFIFYFKEDKFQIMLTLSYCGKVIILDETLQPKEEKELSPDIDYHELTLEHYGDINGDGKMDFLFSDADTLIVLDQNLKIQFSYIFPGFIETVHILPESKNMRILVQSGDLYPLVADKNLTEKDQNRQIELARSKQTV
ncbi:MAG: hypothetical protein KAR21_13740, partial [Spirochaetales bacterium]|nr:hypothetical protein [Spirochaetales bacterium]